MLKIKRYKEILKNANELLDIQGQSGNYNYDSYMLGIYNGMEMIISMFEEREPQFISGKHIIFLNNDNNLKEIYERLNEIQYLLKSTYSKKKLRRKVKAVMVLIEKLED